MAALKTIWFNTLDTDEAELLKKALKQPSLERTRFLEILKQLAEDVERKGFREEDYSSGGWTHLQAFRNGKLAMIRQIIELYT